jgi:formate C-acetyltransferase
MISLEGCESMYKFKPVTERIALMRDRIRNRVIRLDSERAMIVTEAFKNCVNLVPTIRRPTILKAVAEKFTPRVEDIDVLVGNRGRHFSSIVCYPENNEGVGWVVDAVRRGEWHMGEDGLWHNPDTEDLRLSASSEDIENIESIQEFWKNKTFDCIGDGWAPAGIDELKRLGATKHSVFMSHLIGCRPGHLIAGYGKIIDVGYGAIRKQAQDWLDAHFGNIMGDDVKKCLFYSSAVIACDAATIFIRRYGDACLAKTETENDPGRKAELLKMADSLYWISENPARTFWETVQATLMYELLLYQDGCMAFSIGRFDQFTYKYYKNDIENGALTTDQAQEIVDAFFLKLNSFFGGATQYLIHMIGANTYQHTTIGGVGRDGQDVTNPVSYMVLESIARLKLHDPTISLRINKNTPKDIWTLAIETTKIVGGLPLFQNDEVIIPGLIRENGFSLEDAREYAIMGCQEIMGPGMEYPCANGNTAPYSSLNYGTVFNMAINDGKNPFNNEQCSIHTGFLYDMQSIEEVREAMRQLVFYLIKLQVSVDNYTEYLHQFYGTENLISLSMEGCMEKGMDATWGGCKYNSYGGTATGLATIADCITTIKYMCFDKKLISTRELYDAVMKSWEGYEPLRQRILSEVPHYGNGDPYADMEMKWICDTYYAACKECSSMRCTNYKAGLYGASDHVTQGYTTWATPDGRRTGEPIADACSPAQGRDRNGPTAVLMSSCCFDHTRFMDGLAVNLKLHPSTLNGQDGIEKLRDMTLAYFDNGGMEVQYNVVSAGVLRAAQQNPDEYKDLIVRIAGYSAYFVELSLDCQNDLISRHDHQM